MLAFLFGISLCLNIVFIIVAVIYIQLKKNMDIFSNISDEEKRNFKNWSDFYS